MIQGYHVPPKKVVPEQTSTIPLSITGSTATVGHCFPDMPGTLSLTSLENGWLSIGRFSTLKMGCFTISIHFKTSCLGLPGISYVFFLAGYQKHPGNGKVRLKSSLVTKTATSQEWGDWHGTSSTTTCGMASKTTSLP